MGDTVDQTGAVDGPGAVGTAVASGPGPSARRPSRGRAAADVSRDREHWLFLVAVGVLVLSVVAHAERARGQGWYPIGEDAYWTIMSRSVFSTDPPLLGSSSSGGIDVGTAFHHLGPIGFYLLAPFVAVFGDVGVAIGAGVLNAAALLVAVAAARFGLGRTAGWVALVGASAIAYAMGSELLVDPLNPHLIVCALFAGCVCTWAVLCARGASATVWVVPGVIMLSIVLQTHLSAVPVGGYLGLVLLSATVWRSRSGRSRVSGPGAT